MPTFCARLHLGVMLVVTITVIALWPVRKAAAAALTCDVSAIQAVAPPDTTIISAQSKTVLVSYCDVIGEITTSTALQNNTVTFELGLPDAWNYLFLFWGNGGFGGSLQAVDDGTFDFLLGYGFAMVATDTGHESSAGFYGFTDGSFGLIGDQPNLAAREDFAYRAVHVSTVASKAIVSAYYPVPPAPYYLDAASFFDGCSTGGRQGLVEAQKYPYDFIGIVSGDPGIGNPVAGFNWNDQALLKSNAGYLSSSDIQLVDQAVMAECDDIDGVADGLIQDPRNCHFNPKSLTCKGSSKTNCLNNQQIKTLQAIFSGAVTNGNQPLYPGFPVSDMGGDDGWPLWISGFDAPQFGVAEPWGAPPDSFAVAPYQWSSQDQFLKYFVFNDPNYNFLNFDFRHKSDVDALNAAINQYQSTGDDPDLSAFFNHGGKLIMYHGWSDPAASPMVSVNYYTMVAQNLYGGDFSRLQQNARLFMVPGMHHCGGGPGPNVFDSLGPVIFWLPWNGGIEPDQIIASHYENNDQTMPVDRTMPLCPYPQVARYNGGPKDDAASWTCGNPPVVPSARRRRHRH
jgi:feruloyl esterase